MNDYDPNHVHKKDFALIGQKAIILNSKNQILVLLRSDKVGGAGKWSLPGGSLENGEEPYAAVKREIEEETQLSVADLSPYFLHTYTNRDNDFVLIVGYRCKVDSEEVVLNWEHDEYKWMSKDQALELNLSNDGRTLLENFRFDY
ncbi:MAG TPA: NUDIX hydrolase [Patescibacteria group bacterium]|nr:NUDIX hydrolase [Patescibacteria group bacterium]